MSAILLVEVGVSATILVEVGCRSEVGRSERSEVEDGEGPWAGARPPRPSSFFRGQVFFEYDPSSATSLLSSVGDHCVGECSEGPSTGALPRAAGSGRPAQIL